MAEYFTTSMERLGLFMSETTKESIVLVRFQGPGSSEFSISLEGVTYNQVLLVASYLEMKAKSLILQTEAQAAEEAERQRLSVPKAEILRA